MKIAIAVILSAFALETQAAFVSPTRKAHRATFALFSENDDGKEGPWLSGEVDGNGHIIDGNLQAKFRKMQLNYESDCQPTWKRAPNPPKTTADFLQHLETVRIGEEVGKPTKKNPFGTYEKPVSSWITETPRRPLEGDILAHQTAPAPSASNSAPIDVRTKMAPQHPPSFSPWIDHTPRKPLAGDFSVHEYDMEEKKRNLPPSRAEQSKELKLPIHDQASSLDLNPSASVPLAPLPLKRPGSTSRFSPEYHSGHHPSWFHFSTSDALIGGSTLKRIRITEQSPFYFGQSSNASAKPVTDEQEIASGPSTFVDAEFEEDELASEVTRLREMALEAAESARVAELEAAEKSQQARKASEEARLAELHAVEKAVAARDAAQTARLALENLRKVREEEAARLAEEARLEALREKEEQARLEALEKKRELAQQEEIAREMKRKQDELLQLQEERARKGEEIAAKVKKEQQALLNGQRERTIQEKSARIFEEEQETELNVQNELINEQDIDERTDNKQSSSELKEQRADIKSEVEAARLREEFRIAQIAKQKMETEKEQKSSLAPLSAEKIQTSTIQNDHEEVERLLALAIDKQKELFNRSNDVESVTINGSSTKRDYQRNMKNSFRRDERTSGDDKENSTRDDKSPETSSSQDISEEEEEEEVLRSKIDSTMGH
ncbi:hypothetical protein FisN_9Hh402 [Fistulifera solaris]|jgi:hypothetical protein|uniref:Uncharacterized protein n=1 Tax=Fistulifera solaris TaxID=1519565 RepID=A0A1Z5KDW1_FISSO|nr:hypothetical protein FisN_9Hh402 [Fistulifera solaris]|eukprot:GAX24148.1 hypothetical protein FisN_9Hh402 [Fistulifera solaris]